MKRSEQFRVGEVLKADGLIQKAIFCSREDVDGSEVELPVKVSETPLLQNLAEPCLHSIQHKDTGRTMHKPS